MTDLNKELEEANAALWRCVELSGEDTSDGIPSWPPLHEFAVQAVEQLRKDSDEGTDELATELADERTLVASLERQLEEARGALQEIATRIPPPESNEEANSRWWVARRALARLQGEEETG